jgi:hypothetical protein
MVYEFKRSLNTKCQLTHQYEAHPQTQAYTYGPKLNLHIWNKFSHRYSVIGSCLNLYLTTQDVLHFYTTEIILYKLHTTIKL